MRKHIFMSILGICSNMLIGFSQMEITRPCIPFANAVELPQKDTTLEIFMMCDKLFKFNITSNALLVFPGGINIYLNDTLNPYTKFQRRSINNEILYVLSVKAGDKVYFVSNYANNPSFIFLNEVPEAGANFESAIRLFNGETSISSGSQRSKWCSYVFPEKGVVIVNTTATAIYAYKGKPKYEDIDHNGRMLIDNQLLTFRIVGDNLVSNSPIKINGNKGDVVYFKLFDSKGSGYYITNYTEPMWRVSISFQKSKNIVGCERNNPFVLNLNETKEYPLLVPIFNSHYSIFRVDNPSSSPVKYKLISNVDSYILIDNKQVWENRILNQSYIFSIPAKSSYIFMFAPLQQNNPVSIKLTLTTASGSDIVSDYTVHIAPTPINVYFFNNYKLQPELSYRFIAPEDGIFQVNYFSPTLSYLNFYLDSSRTIDYSNREYPNAVILNKGDKIYFAPQKKFADTVLFKANFFPWSTFFSFNPCYYSITNDTIKTGFSVLPGDSIISITVPLDYAGNVLVKYSLVPGARFSLDPYNSKTFTLSNPITYGEINYKSKTKKYKFILQPLSYTRTEKKIISFNILNQKGPVIIDEMKKEIKASVEKQAWGYTVSLTLSPGAYIPGFSNYLFDNTSLVVFAEDGSSVTYNVIFLVDSNGYNCNNAIAAQIGKNTINKTNFPVFYKYTPKDNNAILIEWENTDDFNYIEVSQNCNLVNTFDGKGKLFVKGFKNQTFEFAFFHPTSSFTLTEIPYLKNNDILDVIVNRKYYIDRQNKIIWLQAEPNWSGTMHLKLSEGATSLHPTEEEAYANPINIFGLPDSVRITAMNGDTAWWKIRAGSFRKEPAFISYTLPFQIAPTQIDTLNLTITCFVPDNSKDTIRFMPAYVLSNPNTTVFRSNNPFVYHISGLSIDTLIFVNDLATLQYKVYVNEVAELWTVKVYRAKTSHLISFNLEGQVNTPVIDHLQKTVTCLLQPYVDRTKVATYFTVAPGANVKVGSNTISSGSLVNYATVSTLQVIKNDTSTYELNIKQLPKPCSAKFSYTISNDTVYVQAEEQKSDWIYFWNFGDNSSTSGIYNVFHVYKAGVYSLTLTVYDPSSECIDTYVEKIEIGDVASCKALFSYNIEATSKKVTLTNQSKGDIFFWSFDDGSFSVETSPVKTYAKNGVYKITLITTNASRSCKDVYSRTINLGDSCEASFSYLVDTLKQTVKLYANRDYPGLQHTWITGDGQMLWGPTPELNFISKGIYTITHTVVDNSNLCTDKVRLSFEIGTSGDVEADFTVLPENSAVKFFNLTKGNAIKYIWNFGDGTLSNAVSPSHTFNAQGVFNVCLTATSAKGISNTKCKKVLSQPLASNNCVADFYYYVKPDSLKAICIDRSLGNINHYMWDFGDGSTSTQPSVIYSYNAAGYYLVVHTVGSEQGCSDKAVRLLNVGNPHAIKCQFLSEQNQLMTKAGGYPVDFIGAGLGDDVRIKWNFGDGTIDTTTLSPTHVYNTPGTYTVCLTITDPITQQEDTYCQQVTVMGDNIRLLAENEIWSIYPVPFGNYLEIQLNNPITGRVTIDLFDMSGRKITAVNNTLLPAGWHKLRFDASKLKAGSYLIRLVHAQGTLTQLITKQ